MKFIKTYEEINSEPQIGDYIIIKADYAEKDFKDFFAENIGTVYSKLPMKVHYNNIPNKLKFGKYKYSFGINNDWFFTKEDIVYFSKNKEDLKPYLYANKYNL